MKKKDSKINIVAQGFSRRKFLAGGVTTLALSVIGKPALAMSGDKNNSRAETVEPDGLNPPGIRTAGIKMVPVVRGKYKVWTKRIGRGAVKVLLLHGGPGASHEYLEAFESFLPEAGIEMYYYDQLGCNNSDQSNDSSLWTIPRYVEEIEEVRKGLGLDNFVLYGHSCGGLFALEYALKYQQHLKGLIISNMTASSTSYLRYTNTLKNSLPADKLKELNALENKQAYDSPEYTKIMMEDLYPQFICRTKPWPESVTRSFKHFNNVIYEQMQGKSEFLVTGNIKDWDVWDRLHEIKVKTLTIGAKYDEMDPADMKKMSQLVAKGSHVYCSNGSHFSMWDDQKYYFKHLLNFLGSI